MAGGHCCSTVETIVSHIVIVVNEQDIQSSTNSVKWLGMWFTVRTFPYLKTFGPKVDVV
jgi:hypothetical protein